MTLTSRSTLPMMLFAVMSLEWRQSVLKTACTSAPCAALKTAPEASCARVDSHLRSPPP